MSIWDIRQWLESRTPWWVMPAVIIAAAIIYGWIDFNSYGKRLRK